MPACCGGSCQTSIKFTPCGPSHIVQGLDSISTRSCQTNIMSRTEKAHRFLCELFETGLTLLRLLLFCGCGSRSSRSGRGLGGRHRSLRRCGRSSLLSSRSRSFFFFLAASCEGESQSQAKCQRDHFFHCRVTSFLLSSAYNAWFLCRNKGRIY